MEQIKVFYTGYGFYKRITSNSTGTPLVEFQHGDDYVLFDHDIETLEHIGEVIINGLGTDIAKTNVFITDKDGNPDTFKLIKGQDVYKNDNGNMIKVYWNDNVPTDEKPNSEREHTTMLNIIYGLLELLKKDGQSQNKIISELVKFDYRGLKKSTLENYFSKANKINERD